MSIETCTYNAGKMCKRIGKCYKRELLNSQAMEGGSANPDLTGGVGPYMSRPHWEGINTQVLGETRGICGEKEQLLAELANWNNIKEDPYKGFLIDTGGESLTPDAWQSGSGVKPAE